MTLLRSWEEFREGTLRVEVDVYGGENVLVPGPLVGDHDLLALAVTSAYDTVLCFGDDDSPFNQIGPQWRLSTAPLVLPWTPEGWATWGDGTKIVVKMQPTTDAGLVLLYAPKEV